MRSISIKIILVLVIISLVGALFTTFFIQTRTRTAFDDFIQSQNQLALAELLTTHFQENASWEDAEVLLQNFSRMRFPAFPGGGMQGRNPNRPGENQPPPAFILTDPQGTVLASNADLPGFQTGDQIGGKDLKKSLELEIDGTVQGLLVPVPSTPSRSSMQQSFLMTVQRGLVISSLVTLLIALVLGGLLITSFTRPIRSLAAGTERIASGELGYQVDINTTDELGRLASSFNEMSLDLQQADQQRKQMTADIAHDLRTPLSILYGYTEALSEGKMAGSPETFRTMHGQTRHLNYLIEDLRTLSLLDSDQLNFQIKQIDPEAILKQTQAAFEPLASGKGLTLALDIAENLPRVMLDPDRLTQILGNLLNNAINIVPGGGKIVLKAWRVEDKLALEVTDDGPGIAEQDLPLIFNRHYKIDRSRSQEVGSSGLGLAITKKLVEAQGGKITAASQPGRGTSFQIIFPL